MWSPGVYDHEEKHFKAFLALTRIPSVKKNLSTKHKYWEKSSESAELPAGHQNLAGLGKKFLPLLRGAQTRPELREGGLQGNCKAYTGWAGTVKAAAWLSTTFIYICKLDSGHPAVTVSWRERRSGAAGSGRSCCSLWERPHPERRHRSRPQLSGSSSYSSQPDGSPPVALSAARRSGESGHVLREKCINSPALGILPTGRFNPTLPKRRTAWAQGTGPRGGGPQRSPVAHGVLLPELPQVFPLPLAQAARQLPPAAPLPHAGSAALYGTAVRGGCRNAAWRRAAGGCSYSAVTAGDAFRDAAVCC